MVTEIRTVLTQEILDCRGSPTVFATVVLQNGSSASASVPSGASVGPGETFELSACLAPKLSVAFSSAA